MSMRYTNLRFIIINVIGKRVMDFLLAIIDFFSLDVTTEALRADMLKIGVAETTVSVLPKISGTRGHPPSTVRVEKLG